MVVGKSCFWVAIKVHIFFILKGDVSVTLRYLIKIILWLSTRSLLIRVFCSLHSPENAHHPLISNYPVAPKELPTALPIRIKRSSLLQFLLQILKYLLKESWYCLLTAGGWSVEVEIAFFPGLYQCCTSICG